MPRKEIPIIGGAYASKSPNIDVQESVNFYPVIDKEGGNIISLSSTPGLEEWKDFNSAYPTREMLYYDSYLWVCIGASIYKVDSDGTSTLVSGSLSTSSGFVYMEGNGNDEICILDVENGSAHYISSMSLNNISLPFSNPYTLTYQDGYGIITEQNSGRFWISGLNDFSTWSALDYGTAESLPDDVIAAKSDRRQLWLFGEKTLEPFQNTGDPDFPFQRIISGIQEVGISAPKSIVSINNALFFLDNWGNVRLIQGYTPSIVSTEHMNYQISTYPSINDSYAMGYVHEGHTFYLITFPSANRARGVTWCFDLSTGFWHKRASFPRFLDGKWRASCAISAFNQSLFGDYDSGKIYRLNHSQYSDDGNVLSSMRRGQTFRRNGRFFFIHEFEILIQSGVGIATGQGSDPQIMFRYSTDAGQTWSNELWESMGKAGEYTYRVKWETLGRPKEFTPEITITDPVNRTILGAYITYTDVSK